MKKFFCFALAIMMLFAFAACSNSSDGPAGKGNTDLFADRNALKNGLRHRCT